jgi:hypothetical protein
MSDTDLFERAQRMLAQLKESALAAEQSHGNGAALVMQSLGLCLELQCELVIELGLISRRLERILPLGAGR